VVDDEISGTQKAQKLAMQQAVPLASSTLPEQGSSPIASSPAETTSCESDAAEWLPISA
jgi:hypothetical protein